MKAQAINNAPLGRTASVDDVAAAATYLASDAAACVTGQVIGICVLVSGWLYGIPDARSQWPLFQVLFLDGGLSIR